MWPADEASPPSRRAAHDRARSGQRAAGRRDRRPLGAAVVGDRRVPAAARPPRRPDRDRSRAAAAAAPRARPAHPGCRGLRPVQSRRGAPHGAHRCRRRGRLPRASWPSSCAAAWRWATSTSWRRSGSCSAGRSIFTALFAAAFLAAATSLAPAGDAAGRDAQLHPVRSVPRRRRRAARSSMRQPRCSLVVR